MNKKDIQNFYKGLNPKKNIIPQYKKGGRPKKTEEEKYLKYLIFRMTKEEHKNIFESLNEFGYKNFSNFCRDLLINKRVKIPYRKKLPDDINYELNKIGNNLNQIAYKINIDETRDIDKTFKDFVYEVSGLLEKIQELLIKYDSQN